MAIKHAAITDPTGVTLTGCLIHEKRTRIEDVNAEVMDNDGSFEAGKSIRKKTTISCSGEALDTLSLPTVGSGTALAAKPHIDSTEQVDKAEGATDVTIEMHYFAAGAGDYA